MKIIQFQFNMKLRGSLLVIVCCLVVEFCNLLQPSTATDNNKPISFEHSCCSGWYTTVSTGDCESDSKTEERSNADKNVDRSIPLTTSSSLVHHSGC